MQRPLPPEVPWYLERDAMSKQVVLVVDLDNTLYDFAAYFSPSFRAMVHVLSPRLEISETDLTIQFAKVFEQRGSLEYQFAVQELDCVRELPESVVVQLVHLASVAFGRTRRRRLRLYPHVRETLKWASEANVKICAVTNAPLYQAYRRIRDLGILKFFNAISSRDGTHIPESLGDFVRKRDSAMEILARKMDRVATHSHSVLKPHDNLFLSVIDQWKTVDHTYYAVGDSIVNDLVPAHFLGMKTIWARYGTVIDPKDLQTMIAATPIRNRPADSEMVRTFVPDCVIDDFGELLKLLPVPRQLPLL